MEIIIIIFLILLNGFFSMSEISLVSARKFKLESAAKKGSKRAKYALQLSNNPNTFLSAVQIGITLIGILTGIFSGEKLTADLKLYLSEFPAIAPYAHPISVACIVFIITFFSIVFGELIPKRIGLMFPEKIALAVAQPMTIISNLTRPFIWLLTSTNDLILKILGLKNQKEGSVSEEEIKAIISESTESGEIQEIEQNIVNRVFALGDRTVSELMTHRSDLIWFNITDDLATIKRKIGDKPHSVYPVCNQNLDDVIGIVSIKDIFLSNFSKQNFHLKNFLKKPTIVHENFMIYNVLDKFRESKIHYALIVDEYGVLQGIIGMDDVLDALIGDMSEYNHQADYTIVQRNENSWLADGQLPFFEFLQYFDLSEEDYEGSYNTLGGLIIDKLNEIPSVGTELKWQNFKLEVVDMDGNRIDKILIQLIA